jgi:hypothetical protein
MGNVAWWVYALFPALAVVGLALGAWSNRRGDGIGTAPPWPAPSPPDGYFAAGFNAAHGLNHYQTASTVNETQGKAGTDSE